MFTTEFTEHNRMSSLKTVGYIIFIIRCHLLFRQCGSNLQERAGKHSLRTASHGISNWTAGRVLTFRNSCDGSECLSFLLAS